MQYRKKSIILNVIFSLNEFYFISSENASTSNFRITFKDLIIKGKDQQDDISKTSIPSNDT